MNDTGAFPFDLPVLSGVPAGYEAFALNRFLKAGQVHLHVSSSEADMRALSETIRFVRPDADVLIYPAWDTVPYDRAAPQSDITGRRVETLGRLYARRKHNDKKPLIVLTTPGALIQKTPPRTFFDQSVMTLSVGQSVSFEQVLVFLEANGYTRTDTVMKTGEYAVRGGLIDVFAAGCDRPVRLDFFGDEIDTIKPFDCVTQRSGGTIKTVTLKPVHEFLLTDDTSARFRTRFRTLFGTGTGDAFYDAVTEKRYVQGIEHFLPLFYEDMGTLFDALGAGATATLSAQGPAALESKINQVYDYYAARQEGLHLTQGTAPYRPIPPELFFLKQEAIRAALIPLNAVVFSPFVQANGPDAGGRGGVDFSAERLDPNADVFAAAAAVVRREKRAVLFAASSDGAAQRLSGLLRDKGVSLTPAATFQEALKHAPGVVCAPFETGFADDSFLLITETDLLGERLTRPVRKKRAERFIEDISALTVGDLVVHQTHGIGRFDGLETLHVGGAKHDLLRVLYQDGDKLFVPVENADVLSRYGDGEGVGLDKLGSTAFMGRKERVKKDLFAMAGRLMDIAAERALNKTTPFLPPHGMYQEFCARFPYAETDDQLKSIQDIENDLARTRPMDRLICGDVGFGKTEIALRAACLTALNGRQVAVVVPTTLLARQHAEQFTARFRGFPVRVDMLSRLTPATRAKSIRAELEQGTLDIVIGTHTLLSKNIKFKDLGLVIIDEEQHFGVAHKERLKEMKTGVHVLTLSATPIPRTLQLSLAGVRELSLIATPPVDRLAVKTFVMPFDPVIVKEAILRERFRGGQTFVVCPRISDLPETQDMIRRLIPDIKIVAAHGRMGAVQLEKIMTDFTDKKQEVLVATSIIESGLDMPGVNTLIVCQADRFGLAALYQLRGRVGRGKQRAYAYLTYTAGKRLSETAQKRLNVMQSLDQLGAGFTLASHDLDIRGAGNLLGDDQSGHIREIGVALYQKMLGDAVRARRAGETGAQVADDDFSPQISVGLAVLIPDTYVHDLTVRLDLYRRIGALQTPLEIEQMKAELNDRFGPYPDEVANLFDVVALKIAAKQANIDKIEAGERGATVSFYRDTFKNPAGLVAFMGTQMGTVRLRPDQKVIVMRPWKTPRERLDGVRRLIEQFAKIAMQG